MTTLDQAREAVQEHWLAGWDDTTPFVFENEQGKESKLGAGEQTWCRVAVRNLNGYQHTLGGIGNRLYTREARVFVQVMAPVNKGMKAGADVAQAARLLFEGVRVGELVFFGGVVRETRPDGKWYVTLAEMAFEYYEKK